MDNKFLKVKLSILLVAISLFSGCKFIKIPELRIEKVKILSGKIDLSSANSKDSENSTYDFNVKIESCRTDSPISIETLLESFEQKIDELPIDALTKRIIKFFVNRIHLQKVIVEKIYLVATKGDFSELSTISAEIKINDSKLISLNNGEINENKDTLTFETNTDILGSLNKDDSEETCTQLIIAGSSYDSSEYIEFTCYFDLVLQLSF